MSYKRILSDRQISIIMYIDKLAWIARLLPAVCPYLPFIFSKVLSQREVTATSFFRLKIIFSLICGRVFLIFIEPSIKRRGKGLVALEELQALTASFRPISYEIPPPNCDTVICSTVTNQMTAKLFWQGRLFEEASLVDERQRLRTSKNQAGNRVMIMLAVLSGPGK